MAAKKKFNPAEFLTAVRDTGGARPFEKHPAVREACEAIYRHLDEIRFEGKIPAADLWREMKTKFGYKHASDNFRRHLRNLNPAKYDKYFGQQTKDTSA